MAAPPLLLGSMQLIAALGHNGHHHLMALFRKGNPTPVQKAMPETTPQAGQLPDSTTLRGTCPRCGVPSSFAHVGSLAITYRGDSYAVERNGRASRIEAERMSVLHCYHCEQSLAVMEELWVGESRWSEANHGGTITWRGFFWWPLPATALSSDVPAEIRGCFEEASLALAAGCPRAAAVMGRRTLEAVCVEKGATEGNLAKRLQKMAADSLLVPTLADWAKEVRLVGNQGAHYDPIEAVSREDASHLLAFLKELLRYLYELPAELQRRRGQIS